MARWSAVDDEDESWQRETPLAASRDHRRLGQGCQLGTESMLWELVELHAQFPAGIMERAQRRQEAKMTDRRVFLTGLAAGAIGGLLVGWRLTTRPHRMSYLDVAQKVLAGSRGEVKAALLAARAQARYDELYAHRPCFHHPALRQHFDEGVLPSLALYQMLREENDDQEAVLAEMDRIVAAMLERSGRRRLVQLIGRLPDPFAILRSANRWAMKRVYPPEGWRFEWVEDSDQCIAYDARECFYLNVLTAYGAPELTAHLCVIDDLLFDDLPGIAWERTQTLGQGDDRCDFRFRRVTASDAVQR
jgi:hypothetical protein